MGDKKGLIEDYVINQAVAYVLDPQNIKRIAKLVVSESEKEWGGNEVNSLEKRVAQLERDMTKLVNAMLEANSSTANWSCTTTSRTVNGNFRGHERIARRR